MGAAERVSGQANTLGSSQRSRWVSEYIYVYCHVNQSLMTVFGLVIGFIDHLQALTTINYNTVTDFHTAKHSTIIFSVYLG
jgi:hypothetical protein